MVSESIPAWKERSRALASKRQRADKQVSRLVRVAEEMVNAGLDVTIPALVVRAQMSTKTFYRHFAARDELTLALMEDELAIGSNLVGKEVRRYHDPVEQLRAAGLAILGLPARYANQQVRQARVQEGQRLTALYPEQTAQAADPIAGCARRYPEPPGRHRCDHADGSRAHRPEHLPPPHRPCGGHGRRPGSPKPQADRGPRMGILPCGSWALLPSPVT